jgi:hypothetical protein
LPYGDPSLITLSNPTVPVNPYFDGDPCSAATNRISNLSRIDMILPETNNGNILTPVLPTYYIVTYYARRRDVTKAYQPIDNPIVLYRAQIPFRGAPAPSNPAYLISDAGAAVAPATSGDQYPASDSLNANIYNSRYTNLTSPTACGTGSPASISANWLTQSTDGEPDLEPLTNENFNSSPAAAFTLFGSHISLLSTGVGMVTDFDYRGYDSNNQPITKSFYSPKSTFTCADTNNDGLIDQVTLSVLLQKVDQSGAEPNGQRITLPQVVNLPNVRSIANVQ